MYVRTFPNLMNMSRFCMNFRLCFGCHKQLMGAFRQVHCHSMLAVQRTSHRMSHIIFYDVEDREEDKKKWLIGPIRKKDESTVLLLCDLLFPCNS